MGPTLELCEGFFDGVEVRAVGREVIEFGTCRLNELTDPLTFVAGEVVHDDDVAWAQFWYEDLLDISLEGVTVDGAVHMREHAVA